MWFALHIIAICNRITDIFKPIDFDQKNINDHLLKINLKKSFFKSWLMNFYFFYFRRISTLLLTILVMSAVMLLLMPDLMQHIRPGGKVEMIFPLGRDTRHHV